MQEELEKSTEEYLLHKRCTTRDIIYSEMAAPSMGIKRLLNGQLTRAENGLYLEYSNKNIHLNEAMKNPTITQSLKAKLFLQYETDPSDYEDLMILLDEYEDPVIEFSVLDRSVGWAKRRMVIWEVRHY